MRNSAKSSRDVACNVSTLQKGVYESDLVLLQGGQRSCLGILALIIIVSI